MLLHSGELSYNWRTKEKLTDAAAGGGAACHWCSFINDPGTSGNYDFSQRWAQIITVSQHCLSSCHKLIINTTAITSTSLQDCTVPSYKHPHLQPSCLAVLCLASRSLLFAQSSLSEAEWEHTANKPQQLRHICCIFKCRAAQRFRKSHIFAQCVLQHLQHGGSVQQLHIQAVSGHNCTIWLNLNAAAF